MKKKNRRKKRIVPFEVSIGIILITTGLTYCSIQKNSSIYPNIVCLIGMGIFLCFIRLIIQFLIKKSKKNKLLTATIKEIESMDGVEFENCCIEHFKQNGYTALPTPVSGDYGADIILKKGKIKTVVQCKRYTGKVGVKAVQEIIGAKGYYNADNAIVITNSFYTPNAIQLAKANKVELWDKNLLVKTFNIH